LVTLIGKTDAALTASQKIYNDLIAEGVEVLWDDRTVSAGEKFADSDLLGMPYRVVVSDRSLANNEVEVKERRSGETAMCAVDELSKYLAEHA
jgi:prolyl-tRNA synthetase